MLSNDKTPFVKDPESSEQNQTYRAQRIMRKIPRHAVTVHERALLYAIAAHLRLGRNVAPNEFRVAASELSDASSLSVRMVYDLRTKFERQGVIVCTDRGDQRAHVPPTYRLELDVLERTYLACQDEPRARSSRQLRPAPDAVPPLHGVQYPPASDAVPPCTGCSTSPAPGADSSIPYESLVAQVESPIGDCAAGAAQPSGRVSQTEGDQTEEAEPDTAPSLHLAAQQSAPAPSGKNQAGRLSAGDSSAWIPEEVPTPGSGVRKKKGKKRSVEPSRSEAPSAALAAPPACPETSPQSPAREAPPVAPVALPDRTREATPRAAPVPVPGDAHPRTPPEPPMQTLTRAIPLVWSGDAFESVPPMTDVEKGFLARYTAAKKAVQYAAIGFQTECLEGEALATFCARTFAANFPRGYSVELAEFLDSRTRTLKAAHALHESREQARRERAAAEAAREEELAKRAKDAETATRAYKKKRSA